MIKRSFVDDYSNVASSDILLWARSWISELRRSGMSSELLDLRKKGANAYREQMKGLGGSPSNSLLFLDVLHVVLNETISIVLAAQPPYSEGANFGVDSRERATISLLMSLSSSFEGVRSLIEAGNDHSARILARSIGESSDLLLVVSLDEEVAQHFVSSAEDFKSFWFRYLAKGKLAKLKRKALESRLGIPPDLVDSTLSYSSLEFEIFSQAVHPSYLGGIMQLLLLMGGSDDEFAFLNEWPCQRVSRYLLDSLGMALSILLRLVLLPSGISHRVNERNDMYCSDLLIENLANGALSACIYAARTATELKKKNN